MARVNERGWAADAIIEEMRLWDPKFYSDSETKWLMANAADMLERNVSIFNASDVGDHMVYTCLKCGHSSIHLTNFCANCGADIQMVKYI